MTRPLVRELVSKEAIAFQKDPKLFNELVGLFEPLVATGDQSPQTLKDVGTHIEKAVLKHTGILVSIGWYNEANAYASVPAGLNLSNPLLEASKVFLGASNREFKVWVDSLRKVDKELTGAIDRKRSRVSGVFSKILCPVMIGLPLFSKNGFIRMTAPEISAILLHELGHLFTFFELLATTMMTNYAMETVLHAMTKVDDRLIRIKLVTTASEIIEANGTNVEKLVDEKNPQIVQAVLMKNAVDYSRSANGSRVYDFRGFEFLADQFASLHGAGRALASALDKLVAWSSVVPRLQSNWSFFHNAVLVMRTMLQVTIHVTALPFLILALAFPGMDEESYDPPRERLMRIRRNLIQALKDPRLSDQQRADLVADTDELDRLIERQPSGSAFMYLYRYLTGGRRQALKQEKFQQDLEALAANDLFLAAHRLSTLKSTP